MKKDPAQEILNRQVKVADSKRWRIQNVNHVEQLPTIAKTSQGLSKVSKAGKNMKPLTIRFPEQLLKSLQNTAAESGKSLNQTIIDTLERGLTGLNTALPPELMKQIEALATQELRPVDMHIQYLLRLALNTSQNTASKSRRRHL